MTRRAMEKKSAVHTSAMKRGKNKRFWGAPWRLPSETLDSDDIIANTSSDNHLRRNAAPRGLKNSESKDLEAKNITSIT